MAEVTGASAIDASAATVDVVGGVQRPDPTAVRSPGLSSGEIIRIVNRHIGESGGYLGFFSYRTHADLYLEYCDQGAKGGTR